MRRVSTGTSGTASRYAIWTSSCCGMAIEPLCDRPWAANAPDGLRAGPEEAGGRELGLGVLRLGGAAEEAFGTGVAVRTAANGGGVVTRPPGGAEEVRTDGRILRTSAGGIVPRCTGAGGGIEGDVTTSIVGIGSM
ncbi:MAG: hypothetical protein CVU63_14560, partial [Deltaproteobacteria bacterium HGW-Deltaproteobacteria-20]